MLICFEGLDNLGKTTQLNKFQVYLNKLNLRSVILKEFDEEFALKANLKSITKNRNIFIKEKILPALNAGYICLLDRFYLSTTVYNFNFDLDFIDHIKKAKRYINSFNLPIDITFLIINDFENSFKISDKITYNYPENVKKVMHNRYLYGKIIDNSVHQIMYDLENVMHRNIVNAFHNKVNNYV